MRVEGWESLLVAYLADNRPFAWGSRDCALWANDWVLACTGVDHGEPWRGKYKTERGAAKRMKTLGFRSVESIPDAHLEPTPVGMAQRGDLVLHPDGMLGICNGRTSSFLTQEAITAIPTLACVAAWRV
jgi:hypothetical protein